MMENYVQSSENILNATQDVFPEHLRSYDALAQYFRAQLQELSTVEKGDRFAHAVAKLVPQTDIGADFEFPELNPKKSVDSGVDLTAQGKGSNKKLYIQSKLWIDRSESIDSIISKFQSYTENVQNNQKGQLTFNFDAYDSHFLIVTLSSLKGILSQYKKKAYSSKKFYHQIMAERKLHFIDGSAILSILQIAYTKINKLSTKITLSLETNIIHKDNVYISIISSSEIKNIYNHVGDALFFENIRDFLGVSNQEKPGRKTPNKEIIKTIKNDASKMLSRNNGLVFSASKVEQGESPQKLILSNGSVVNGCQTTMCLVENAEQECFVPVKIVEISESWDIATAANYQNSVTDIDLELAQYLRPQLVKRAANVSGVKVASNKQSPFEIIEEIYDNKVTYEETRLIYIGLFSKTPNNVFSTNYTELRQDLLNKFNQDDPYGEKTLEILFDIQKAAKKGLDTAQRAFSNPAYAKIFERLYKEENLSYRCFICLLALSGLVNINLADRHADTNEEHKRMNKILKEAQNLITKNRDIFLKYYLYAVKVWMQGINVEGGPTEIQQSMHTRSKRISFNNLFRDLSIERDMQQGMQQLINES